MGIDASVALTWFIEGGGSEPAVAPLTWVDSLIVPGLSMADVCNTGWTAERVGGMTQAWQDRSRTATRRRVCPGGRR